jgi:DNA helicase-2/ATP-dependent DNA helicase PcrA
MDKPLKVIAGAGTGKTELLTRRFVHLVKHFGLRPHRILALTFTKKAAAEMRRRIVNALSAEGLIDGAEAAVMMWIGNFHSIALKLLKQNPLPVGLDPFFDVIDEADQRLILSQVAHDFLDNRLTENGNDFRELMIIDADGFLEMMLSIINRLKSAFIEPQAMEQSLLASLEKEYRKLLAQLKATIQNSETPSSTRRAAEKRLALIQKDKSFEELFLAAAAIIYKNYCDRLASRDVLDFNDLVYYAYKLIKAEPAIKRKFDYILVDEFQDTDRGQYQLLEALSQNLQNVTVVGDKKQLIYEWREAKLENIKEFPGETIPLDENYRSFGQILDTANVFIKSTMPEEPGLRPAVEGGRGLSENPAVKLFLANNRELEASFVAKEIRKLLEQKYSSGDIVILVRGINFAQFLEDALKAERLAYTTVGGCGFYELKETKDILALLRLVCNPFDDLSMVRILQSDLIGLGDASLLSLCRRRNERLTSLYDVLKNEDLANVFPAASGKVNAFIELIEELARSRWTMSLGELFSEILKKTRYIRYLESEEGPRGPRFANAALLYKTVTLFEERHPNDTLEEFLRYLELTESCKAKSSGNLVSDKVQIMTIHQAKGLEFPVVFLAGVTPGVFPPSSRSGNFGYEDTFGIFAKRHPNGDLLVRYEGGFGRIEKSLHEKHQLEENRVMYVALTRARDLLYVTSHGADQERERDFFRLLEGASVEEDAGTTIPISTEIPERKAGKESAPEDAQPRIHIPLPEILHAVTGALARISSVGERRGVTAYQTLELTFSKLALFRQCRRKYALRYLYRLPSFFGAESGDEEYVPTEHGGPLLGNLLHQTLMHYHRELNTAGKADATAIFKELARRQDCNRKILKMGEDMLRKYLAAPLSKKETLFEEKEFFWQISDGDLQIRMYGKIDCIHREGEKLKIVDYKSGLPDREVHKFQLALYRLALESVLHQSGILTGNFYFSTGEEVDYQISEPELIRFKAEIIRDAREIASALFVPKDEKRRQAECADCEFKGFCS